MLTPEHHEKIAAALHATFAACDSPEAFANFARNLADRFYSDASELAVAHQDRNAGRIWTMIAKRLETLANVIDANR